MKRLAHHLESLYLGARHPRAAWLRLTRSIDLRIASQLEDFAGAGYFKDVTDIYDIGANVGLFAEAYAALIRGVKVTCFEPVPATFELLKHRCGEIPGVRMERLALGDQSSVLKMNTCTLDQADSLLMPGQELVGGWEGVSPNGQVDVNVVTLDDYVEQHPSSGMASLKIDVQGYELKVLRGATKTLAQCRSVQVEVSIMEMYKGAPLFPEVWTFLRSHGFELAEIFGLLRSPTHGLPVSCDFLFVNRKT